MAESKSLRVAYGEELIEQGKTNDKIVVMDADLAAATMSANFKKVYPDRFFDFGIAEANMVCAAAGFAHAGFMPFVSTFALFGAGRAYEQIRNSVAYENLNVKFGLSHSGLSVGEDGGSHQSVEDIALMRVLPNMTVLVPCDAEETKKAVRAAVQIDGPVYIRVARPVVSVVTQPDTPFTVGKANVLRDGSDIALMACGLEIPQALQAAELLAQQGVSAAVINHHSIKPFDAKTVCEYAAKCKGVVSCEEHSVIGGLGDCVAEAMAEGGVGCRLRRVGIRDRFGKSGAPDALFREYGIDAQSIADTALEMLK